MHFHPGLVLTLHDFAHLFSVSGAGYVNAASHNSHNSRDCGAPPPSNNDGGNGNGNNNGGNNGNGGNDGGNNGNNGDDGDSVDLLAFLGSDSDSGSGSGSSGSGDDGNSVDPSNFLASFSPSGSGSGSGSSGSGSVSHILLVSGLSAFTHTTIFLIAGTAVGTTWPTLGRTTARIRVAMLMPLQARSTPLPTPREQPLSPGLSSLTFPCFLLPI